VSVQLRDIVSNFPGGLDAEISNMHLQPFQLQLFYLCRAILQSAKIIMYEPLEDGDTTVKDILYEEFAYATILSVTTRENAMHYDNVLALDTSGATVTFGKPENILV